LRLLVLSVWQLEVDLPHLLDLGLPILGRGVNLGRRDGMLYHRVASMRDIRCQGVSKVEVGLTNLFFKVLKMLDIFHLLRLVRHRLGSLPIQR
jgi:hypothetical protein